MNESMKKTIAGLLIASSMTMGAFASGQTEVAPSGTTGTKTQAYENIDDIMVKGISDFTIVQGNTATIEVNGDQAYLDSLNLSNEDGFLQVNGEKAGDLNVVITTPSFSSLLLNNVTEGAMSGFTSQSGIDISLNGDTDFALKNTISAPKIKFFVSSKSHVEGNIETSFLDVRTTGKSTVSLSGITDMLNVNMSNNSTGNFNGLHIQEGDIFTRNDASISAALPGISMVKVETTGDSSVDLKMNGVLTAYARNDSSLTYSGDIRWAGQDTDDDGSISAN